MHCIDQGTHQIISTLDYRVVLGMVWLYTFHTHYTKYVSNMTKVENWSLNYCGKEDALSLNRIDTNFTPSWSIIVVKTLNTLQTIRIQIFIWTRRNKPVLLPFPVTIVVFMRMSHVPLLYKEWMLNHVSLYLCYVRQRLMLLTKEMELIFQKPGQEACFTQVYKNRYMDLF